MGAPVAFLPSFPLVSSESLVFQRKFVFAADVFLIQLLTLRFLLHHIIDLYWILITGYWILTRFDIIYFVARP